MQIIVVAVGKHKETHWRKAQADYVRRLAPFASVEIIEVADMPDTVARDRALEMEAAAIAKVLKPRDFVCALAITGEAFTSEGLARYLDRQFASSFGRYLFVIGGSRGLAAPLVDGADARLSLSSLTFPHAIARIVLLEQLYRAFTIRAGMPYHK
ncbi:MAG: 23S rRNA (pseudouridine(1915)-N(3))-methyltransferase RlmH [Firmicutes bacterium]|nr:23S rRNA (pseudouridine(1915)-N(3))-methyltransferase RlmH [Bacillota bacterium]